MLFPTSYDDGAYSDQLWCPGKDVLAKAKTGTGKTVAFLVRHFVFHIIAC